MQVVQLFLAPGMALECHFQGAFQQLPGQQPGKFPFFRFQIATVDNGGVEGKGFQIQKSVLRQLFFIHVQPFTLIVKYTH